jgi:chemotaxis protein methyltransferase CheR
MSAAPARLQSVEPNHLTTADFDRLAAFIHQTTGIKMPPSKRTMVEGRLRRRATATGKDSLSAYCQSVFEGGDDGPEIVHLIDAITTNKTDFFREPDHFQILQQTVLPELAATKRRAKIWSAACSSGAEPYTLAMVASEFIQSRQAANMVPPAIVATDLCTTVLATARLGIYPAEMIEPIPPALRQRYLLRARDRKSGLARIVPAMRSMVRFGRLNLMAPNYDVDRDFDVIFCRNVLIYFDRTGQAAVLKRLCDHLRPGGVLAVGHSETLNGLVLPLTSIGHTMFRRT